MTEIKTRFARFIQVKTWLTLFIAPLVGCMIKLTEGSPVNMKFVPLFITLLLLASVCSSDFI